MRVVSSLVLSGLCVLPAAGTGPPLSLEFMGDSAASPIKAGTECTGGIQYDDGHFEFGFGFQPVVGEGRYVGRFGLPGTLSRIDAVCLCLTRPNNSTQDSFTGAVEFWSVGPGGATGSLLGSFPASFSGVPIVNQAGTFYRVNIPQGFAVAANKVFIGLRWAPASGAADLQLCADDSHPERSPSYFHDGTGWFTAENHLPPALLGIRAEATAVTLPDGPWLTTPALPDFRFKVRITSGAQQIAGVQEADCVRETLCVSGAVHGRSEVFVRIIGPRPNGFLWPNIVKFTVSQVEIWIEQIDTGQIRYYKLPAQGPADTSLPGLVDREGFEP